MSCLYFFILSLSGDTYAYIIYIYNQKNIHKLDIDISSFPLPRAYVGLRFVV